MHTVEHRLIRSIARTYIKHRLYAMCCVSLWEHEHGWDNVVYRKPGLRGQPQLGWRTAPSRSDIVTSDQCLALGASSCAHSHLVLTARREADPILTRTAEEEAPCGPVTKVQLPTGKWRIRLLLPRAWVLSCCLRRYAIPSHPFTLHRKYPMRRLDHKLLHAGQCLTHLCALQPREGPTDVLTQ